MPEMASLGRVFCTTGMYRLVAGRMLLPWALQGIRPEGEVLEIGGGSGAMTGRLLGSHPGLRAVVTDYDAHMVSAARNTLAPLGSRAVALRADAAALPFASGRFGCVLSFAMLHHVIEWEAALREAARVLRTGGYLIGYDVVDGPVVRMLHRAEGGEVRMMRRDQLGAELTRLPLGQVRSRSDLGGLVVRFAAVKDG